MALVLQKDTPAYPELLVKGLSTAVCLATSQGRLHLAQGTPIFSWGRTWQTSVRARRCDKSEAQNGCR